MRGLASNALLGGAVREGGVNPRVRLWRSLGAARGSTQPEAREMAIDFRAR